MQPRFRDRFDAGRELANRLAAYAGHPDALVLGLPRGGVPVAFELARLLDLPLDVFVVRKLGVPGQEELAMGAVASGGVRVLNQEVVGELGIPGAIIDVVAERELSELQRRERLFRGDRPPARVEGRIAILVDDGLATGSTMRAAIAALRRLQPARLIVAVPVASPDICREIGRDVDEIVCAATPEPFYAVGLWYEDFTQTDDDEVCRLLRTAERFGRGGQGSMPANEEPADASNGG